MKNSFLQLGIVSGFVDHFKTTSNIYIAHKTSYEKSLRRLMNDIKILLKQVRPLQEIPDPQFRCTVFPDG